MAVGKSPDWWDEHWAARPDEDPLHGAVVTYDDPLIVQHEPNDFDREILRRGRITLSKIVETMLADGEPPPKTKKTVEDRKREIWGRTTHEITGIAILHTILSRDSSKRLDELLPSHTASECQKIEERIKNSLEFVQGNKRVNLMVLATSSTDWAKLKKLDDQVDVYRLVASCRALATAVVQSDTFANAREVKIEEKQLIKTGLGHNVSVRHDIRCVGTDDRVTVLDLKTGLRGPSQPRTVVETFMAAKLAASGKDGVKVVRDKWLRGGESVETAIANLSLEQAIVTPGDYALIVAPNLVRVNLTSEIIAQQEELLHKSLNNLCAPKVF